MLRTAAGDRRAWTRLVERHLSAVVGYAWHLLDSHAEAEDVAQETFVRLLSKVGQWQPGGASLRAWLYRVATNLCIDQRRLRRTIGLADAPEPPERPRPRRSWTNTWIGDAWCGERFRNFLKDREWPSS